MSRESRIVAGVLLVVLPTVMYGRIGLMTPNVRPSVSCQCGRGKQEHAAEDHEKPHERVTVAIHQPEHPYSDVQHANQEGREQEAVVAVAKPLPYPK